ncbi:putative MscS family protein YkuT [Thalassobacillus devorans]|uniref:MscS family protein YkuT n=1 Tax=Thalassobacillus devorans TaxID=279813 RepID=A0ABQ1NPT0_9BACI|nr:mechanosensitive ion channel family protein [Thalassobacillus devorans]NIK27727.1 small conductance mechanosensitive channel [Thalassobacillus devorans]GGC80012.1 putative MscS family protein YkuT [Thalassobacillus devorans]
MNLFEDGFQINLTEITELLITVGLKILLLLIAFAIIAPIGRKAISGAINRISRHRKIPEPRTKTLERLTINLFSYIMMFVFVVMLLEMVGIPIGPLLAGAGIVGLAIGFGAQGLVSDIVTGFFILIERQVDVDDYVTAAGYDGVVEEVGLRTTKLRGFDGTLHYIPNREISGVSNHSRGNMRAMIDIGIAYDENIEEAVAVLQRVCDDFAANDERIKEGPDVLGVQTLGSSDIVLRVLGKTTNMEQWGVERDLRKAMKEALDAAGIEIPFPHQVYIEKQGNAEA